eukprot:TRINITY_DN2185_c0_g1_i2.p1 TRINITY_DN2185_c0_g1~~TRINITY_DN2185_c0_g1_i2.p1  ORF type:complete len:756 (+),score=241.84 TRINITY_DN2185_c0_g1_i2:211-2478(+)
MRRCECARTEKVAAAEIRNQFDLLLNGIPVQGPLKGCFEHFEKSLCGVFEGLEARVWLLSRDEATFHSMGSEESSRLSHTGSLGAIKSAVEPFFSNNITRDHRFSADETSSASHHQNALCCPILSSSSTSKYSSLPTVTGAIQIFNKQDGFTEADLTLLELFSQRLIPLVNILRSGRVEGVQREVQSILTTMSQHRPLIEICLSTYSTATGISNSLSEGIDGVLRCAGFPSKSVGSSDVPLLLLNREGDMSRLFSIVTDQGLRMLSIDALLEKSAKGDTQLHNMASDYLHSLFGTSKKSSASEELSEELERGGGMRDVLAQLMVGDDPVKLARLLEELFNSFLTLERPSSEPELACRAILHDNKVLGVFAAPKHALGIQESENEDISVGLMRPLNLFLETVAESAIPNSTSLKENLRTLRDRLECHLSSRPLGPTESASWQDVAEAVSQVEGKSTLEMAKWLETTSLTSLENVDIAHMFFINDQQTHLFWFMDNIWHSTLIDSSTLVGSSAVTKRALVVPNLQNDVLARQTMEQFAFLSQKTNSSKENEDSLKSICCLPIITSLDSISEDSVSKRIPCPETLKFLEVDVNGNKKQHPSQILLGIVVLVSKNEDSFTTEAEFSQKKYDPSSSALDRHLKRERHMRFLNQSDCLISVMRRSLIRVYNQLNNEQLNESNMIEIESSISATTQQFGMQRDSLVKELEQTRLASAAPLLLSTLTEVLMTGATGMNLKPVLQKLEALEMNVSYCVFHIFCH